MQLPETPILVAFLDCGTWTPWTVPDKYADSKNSSPSYSRIIVASTRKVDSNGPLSSPGTASSSSRASWPSSSAIIVLAILAILSSSAALEADLFRLSDLVKYLGCSSDLSGTGVDSIGSSSTVGWYLRFD